MLFEVSERIDDKNDIRRLGLKLNVEPHIINPALANDANSLTNAVHTILKHWFNRQNDCKSAYHVLAQTLRGVELNMIAHDAATLFSRLWHLKYKVGVFKGMWVELDLMKVISKFNFLQLNEISCEGVIYLQPSVQVHKTFIKWCGYRKFYFVNKQRLNVIFCHYLCLKLN